MDLILWRHAEAEEGQNDLERRLTLRGHRHAEKMACWLLRQLRGQSLPLHLVASSACRSQQTMSALSKKFEIDPRLNPGASASMYLDICDWPPRKEGVTIIVGHQPEIGRAAGLILTGREVDWSVKKGAVWWLQQRIRDHKPQYVLRAMMTPDML